jgi:electron transfer flavoprotein beta subunit
MIMLMNGVPVSGLCHPLGWMVKTMPNIAVLVKRVPDTIAKITVVDGSIDLSAVKWIISPYDEYAIESALQHREAKGGTVTAITLGNSDCDKTLKDAKALGCDELVRLWQDGWESLDSNGVQSILSEAISELGSEVVYCGKAAADTDAGSTGPGVAEKLGWASISNVVSVSFEDSGVEALVPIVGGQAKVGINFPCLLTIDKGPNEPRRPNVRGIMMAKKAEVNLKGGEAPTATISVISNSTPPAKPPGKTFQGAENVPAVVQALRDEANVI